MGQALLAKFKIVVYQLTEPVATLSQDDRVRPGPRF